MTTIITDTVDSAGADSARTGPIALKVGQAVARFVERRRIQMGISREELAECANLSIAQLDRKLSGNLEPLNSFDVEYFAEALELRWYQLIELALQEACSPPTTACPGWCTEPDWHPYDDPALTEDGTDGRLHSTTVGYGPHGSPVRIEAFEDRHADGHVEQLPVHISYAYAGDDMTAKEAIELASLLTSAAALVNRIDRGEFVVGTLRPNILRDLGCSTPAELANKIGYDDVTALTDALAGGPVPDDLMSALLRHYPGVPPLYFVTSQSA